MSKKVAQLMMVFFSGVAVFYGLPLVGKLIPSSYGLFFIIITLFLINPMYSFITSKLFATYNSFKWYIPVIIAGLFFSTVFIFFNESAIIYCFIYFVMSLMGSWLGSMSYKKRIISSD